MKHLAVTGQAIRDQQQATDRLAAAMTQLTEALELSAKEAEVSCMASTCPDQGQQSVEPEMGMDMTLPGVSVKEAEASCMAATCSDQGHQSLKPEMDMDMVLPGVSSRALTPSTHHVAKTVRRHGQQPRRSMTLQQVDCIESCVAKVEKKRKEGNRIFADPEDLKEKVRANLTREPYDVSKFYRQTGACQAIIRSPWFEMASLILVMVSSVWMAVDIDHNDSPALHKADPIFQIVAHLLCSLFFAELLVRLFAFQLVRDSLRDRWIVFDVVLVVLYVFETWILGITAAVVDRTLTGGGVKLIVIFRVLRLLRILRLARVLQHLPELMVIIHGLSRALRAIAVVLLLLGIVVYVGAIVFTAAFDGSTFGKEWFPDVPTSMGTLLLDCTLSGARGTGLMRAAWKQHPLSGMMVLGFVLTANLTMLGVLTGLLVQTVKTVAEVEKEEKSVRTLVDSLDYLWRHVLTHDYDCNSVIDLDEFKDLLSLKQTATLMRSLDVDVEGLAGVCAFVFEQNQGSLGRQQFLQMVLDLRNSQKATVKDHIETRKFMEGAVCSLSPSK